MDKNIFMSLLKYSLLTVVVYLVLKYLPNQYINETDLMFVTVIIVLFYLLAENIVKLFYNEGNLINENMCNSICNSRIENMENIASNENNIVSQESELQQIYENKLKEREQEIKDLYEKLKKEDKVESKKDEANTDTDIEEEIDIKDNEEDTVMDNEAKYENNESNVIMKTTPKSVKGVERTGDRGKSGTITNEMEYSDYHHLPLADGYDVGNFEYGYSFLPPEKWYPEPPFPPLCVSNNRCQVMPTYTTGTPIDVKEWNEARRITPPDNIKTKYIKEKLNSGR